MSDAIHPILCDACGASNSSDARFFQKCGATISAKAIKFILLDKQHTLDFVSRSLYLLFKEIFFEELGGRKFVKVCFYAKEIGCIMML